LKAEITRNWLRIHRWMGMDASNHNVTGTRLSRSSVEVPDTTARWSWEWSMETKISTIFERLPHGHRSIPLTPRLMLFRIGKRMNSQSPNRWTFNLQADELSISILGSLCSKELSPRNHSPRNSLVGTPLSSELFPRNHLLGTIYTLHGLPHLMASHTS